MEGAAMTPQERDTLWRKVLTSDGLPGATGFLGWRLIDLDAEVGWCEAAFLAPPETLNPGGNVQGGMISAMLDEVMSVAACIVQPVYGMAPTLQMTTNFLRPAPSGDLRARGEVVRAGRTAVHTSGTLLAPDGTPLATAVAACVPKPMPGAYSA
ncbi:MAG: PaaI family thioesterase [Pseudomonadota bacterium]